MMNISDLFVKTDLIKPILEKIIELIKTGKLEDIETNAKNALRAIEKRNSLQKIGSSLMTEIKHPTYHKINSLYKRNEKSRKFTNEFSKDEFYLIKHWDVYEKIDGTNIRIQYTPGDKDVAPSIYIGGRTNDAQIPANLYDYLKNKFNLEAVADALEGAPGILFGEGYGPKIQQGGYYDDKVGFVLFDISIGNWWLKHDAMLNIAEKLDVPLVKRLFTDMTIPEIEKYVRSNPNSVFAKQEHIAEGVVCRPNPLLLDRSGSKILFKLKCVDFKDV